MSFVSSRMKLIVLPPLLFPSFRPCHFSVLLSLKILPCQDLVSPPLSFSQDGFPASSSLNRRNRLSHFGVSGLLLSAASSTSGDLAGDQFTSLPFACLLSLRSRPKTLGFGSCSAFLVRKSAVFFDGGFLCGGPPPFPVRARVSCF